jgi:hypothetical protein
MVPEKSGSRSKKQSLILQPQVQSQEFTMLQDRMCLGGMSGQTPNIK